MEHRPPSFGSVLKDEPEDLTHLAPTAGDGCVPLEGNTFMSDMFDDLLLGPLDDAADPFLAYREDADLSNSPHLPALDQSPMPSLGSPESPDDMTCLMSLGDDTDVDEELSMRAPYIPMGEGDDLPLLISADLLWGPLEPPTSNSCLEQLLRDEPPNVPDSLSRSPVSDMTEQSPISDSASTSPFSDASSDRFSLSSAISPRLITTHTQPVIIKNENDDDDDSSEFLLQIYKKKKKKGSPGEVELPLSPLHQKTAGKNGPTDSGGLERANKRGSSAKLCAGASKRSREEGSGELLRHLMTVGGPPPRDSAPQSDSVLMNLLVSGCDSLQLGMKRKLLPQEDHTHRKSLLLDLPAPSKSMFSGPDVLNKPLFLDPDLHTNPLVLDSDINCKSMRTDPNPDNITPLSVYRKALLINRDKHIVQDRASQQDLRSLLERMPHKTSLLDIDVHDLQEQVWLNNPCEKTKLLMNNTPGKDVVLASDSHNMYNKLVSPKDPGGKMTSPLLDVHGRQDVFFTSNNHVHVRPFTPQDPGGKMASPLSSSHGQGVILASDNHAYNNSLSPQDPGEKSLSPLPSTCNTLFENDKNHVPTVLHTGGSKIAYLAALHSKAYLSNNRESPLRSRSFSLLDPDGRTIPSLVDLSQRDCEVNAPLNGPKSLLHGQELLTALEAAHGIMQ